MIARKGRKDRDEARTKIASRKGVKKDEDKKIHLR
jgi:hypothetical protein